MNARADGARDFVDTTDWAGAPLTPLAGDAGNRSYFRLTSRTGHNAVLMDAPPAKGEDTRPFLTIGSWLRDQGLSAPRVYAQNIDAGFLLLEDLGDALFARVAAADPAKEQQSYEAAVDALLVIARADAPPVDPYDPATMGPLAGLAGSWYAGDAALAEDIAAATTAALATLPPAPALALRDFHAENLLWLPERSSAARVGLLDFQDARVGHAAYDLASLLRDARRDVPEDLKATLATRFGRGMGWSDDETQTALSIQGAQRNLRILGVFARLSLHFAKPQYVDLIPRVWANLQAELGHPDLADLRAVAAGLPAPDAPHLKDLKDRCGTIPTLA